MFGEDIPGGSDLLIVDKVEFMVYGAQMAGEWGVVT